MYQAIVQQQEEAGSLANFCPSVVVNSDSPANETVECKVKWEDDEEENVISVCEFLKFLPTALQLNIKTFHKALYGESHEKVAFDAFHSLASMNLKLNTFEHSHIILRGTF